MADSNDNAAWVFVTVALVVGLARCDPIRDRYLDPNSKPTYGEESGLPKNCRAIVQANIDAYRAHEFTSDEIMNSLERNCGASGYSWGWDPKP